MDEIQIPDDLSSLSVSELQALLTQIDEAGKALVEAAKGSEGEERKGYLADIATITEAKERVTTQLAVAEEAAAAEEEAIEQAAAAFDPPASEGGDEEEEGESEEETPATETPETPATEEVEEPEAVAASGGPIRMRFPKRAERRQVPQARETRRESPFTTGEGQTVESLTQLADLFKRAGQVFEKGGGMPVRIARLNRFLNVDPNQIVHGNDARRNAAILAAATVEGNDAIMAAGGFCGPAEAITAIVECGRTDTPIAGRIPTINARGEYRFVRQVGLEDVNAGISYWTEAEDVAVDPDVSATWKPCYHLECEEEIAATPVGIPLCFEYGTFQNWSHPEQVAAALAKFDVALARRKEALVLQRLHELSNQYTYVPPIGTGVQNGLTLLISQLLQLAGYNGRNSLDGYLLSVPEALILQLLADARLKAWVGPTLTKADILAGLEDTFQIEIVESPDVRVNAPAPVDALPAAPAPDGGAVPCPHTRLEVQLWKPSDFRHGVDTVDIVVQTSIDQARRNDKSVFLETIETTEKLGCSPSFSVLYDGLAVTGTQPDLTAVDDTYCAGPTPDPYGVLPIGFPGGAVS